MIGRSTSRVRALQPASGTFRWLQKPDPRASGGVLVINDTPYLLTPVKTEGRSKDRPVVGWRLVKSDGTIHDVQPANPYWLCDCGDFTFNRNHAPTPALRECKHCRALKAALPLAGVAL